MIQSALQTSTPPVQPADASALCRRAVAGSLVFVTGVILGVAAWLEPASAGFGTHQQLGLPQCTWPGVVGLPCPTCGMTTAFAFAANGQLSESFVAQPVGCMLALAAAMIFLLSAYVLVTASPLGTRLARLWSWKIGWSLVAAIAFSWVYKIAVFRGWF